MVDLKRFHFGYDRPAVLPRWAAREMVFNLGRSFFGCIMWSQQDPFQIQIGHYRSQMSLSSWASAEVDSPRERDPKRSCRVPWVNDALVPARCETRRIECRLARAECFRQLLHHAAGGAEEFELRSQCALMPRRLPHGSVPPTTSRLYQRPLINSNLGRSFQPVFLERFSLYRFNLRQIKQIVDEQS